MTIDELKNEIVRRSLPSDEAALEAFHTLTVLLKEWNAKFNLTAVDEPEEVYEKHILDCLLPLGRIPQAERIVDVGSGAGFPGLVWASVWRDSSFVLLEPTKKRCTFLSEASSKMGLHNVEIVSERAEDYVSISRESFDLVTARAVAGLTVLSELSVPLVKVGGTFAAMKGAKGQEEAEEARYALTLLGCGAPKVIADQLPSGDQRTLILAKKLHPTPAAYPRPYSRIKQKPLREK
ncbi:MAG: 16S rRNA (guanine(527)-N(7))-methyltransferase RsmG [Solobacterium sp.]|nr:16S rRNA (guanine(527)-N(7))-methyltransferase RsmG [Solobacterium sp.]